jgi:hypothetical protein
MPDLLPAQKTPCDATKMLHAMAYAWTQLFQTTASKDSLCVLLAQWAFETGSGAGCWCWNIGNFKAHDGDGRDYTYFACNEILPVQKANACVAKAGWREDGSGKRDVVITSISGSDATTWFYPNNPTSRFRAYHTLEAGVLDYLASLQKRFNLAWPSVLSGNPEEFVHELKIQGYFTDSEQHYKANVVAYFHKMRSLDFTPEQAPTFTDQERDRYQALVTLTSTSSVQADLTEQEQEPPPSEPA